MAGTSRRGGGSKSPPPININKTVGHKTSSFQTNYYVINVKYQYRSISTSLYTSMEVPPLEGGGSRTSGTCPMIHHGQPLSNYVRNAKYQYRNISTSLNTSMEVPPLGGGGSRTSGTCPTILYGHSFTLVHNPSKLLHKSYQVNPRPSLREVKIVALISVLLKSNF